MMAVITAEFQGEKSQPTNRAVASACLLDRFARNIGGKM